MTAKLEYRWHLRELMAARGMFATTALRPLLAERGIALSPSQVHRLVVEVPERLSLRTLMALLDILGCRMEELIEPMAASAVRHRRVAGETRANDLGDLRPKRARIVPDSTP